MTTEFVENNEYSLFFVDIEEAVVSRRRGICRNAQKPVQIWFPCKQVTTTIGSNTFVTEDEANAAALESFRTKRDYLRDELKKYEAAVTALETN